MEEYKSHKKNIHQVASQGGRKVTSDFYQNQVKKISSNLVPETIFLNLQIIWHNSVQDIGY